MAKTNAKQEFLLHIGQILTSNPEAQLLCCTITNGDNHSSWEEEQKWTYQLTTGFTQEEYNQFLEITNQRTHCKLIVNYTFLPQQNIYCKT